MNLDIERVTADTKTTGVRIQHSGTGRPALHLRPTGRWPLVPAQQTGFSIVELMVAMLLGLILLGAVVAAFISSSQTTRLNQNLTRLHEDARLAIDTMAQEIREAGRVACGSNLPVANVINNATGRWWSNWNNNQLRGYAGNDDGFPKKFGNQPGERKTGTEALILISDTLQEGVTLTSHSPTTAKFYVNPAVPTWPGFRVGDIAIVCDYQQAAIFQITNVQINNGSISNGNIIEYNTPGAVSPGNCSKGLGFPTKCTPDGQSHAFDRGGILTKLTASGWFIGRNDRGSTSLYRLTLQNSGGKADTTSEEIAEGATDLRFDYLLAGSSDFLPAASVSDWSKVIAVRVNLTFETLEKVGADMQKITRTWPSVIALRNRQP
ncbi:MAG: PilW family protein [Caldilinea sp.]